MSIQIGWWNVRQRERTRIARELHDTLLQSAQGLILVFQRIAADLPEGTRVRERAEAALEQADQLLCEAREGVLELRGGSRTPDLVRLLRNAGDQIFRDSPVIFRLVVQGAPRELPRCIANELYRLGREALTNAAQHARARAVEVQWCFQANTFRLCVADDGIGIPAEVIRSGGRDGHFGIRGMLERACDMRAVLHIRHRPEGGTQIELTVPAVRADRFNQDTPQAMPARLAAMRLPIHRTL
jgi:signal transduction histidine kinase